jgi:hypothetical protein
MSFIQSLLCCVVYYYYYYLLQLGFHPVAVEFSPGGSLLCETNTKAVCGIIGVSHTVRLTSDPQSSMTEVNSWQESLTEAAGELA